MPNINLLLTRHGKTIFNNVSRVQGWSDTPLTDEGEKVATHLGRGLMGYPVDAIYSSTSGRAIETANIIAMNGNHRKLIQKQLKSLRELYFGKYEGEMDFIMLNDIAEVLGANEGEAIMSGSYTIQQIVDSIARLDETNEAETWQEYSTRLLKGLDEIIEDAFQNDYKEVLVVTHSFTISAILYLIGKESRFTELSNASVSKIKYSKNEYTIESINDMSYVRKGSEAIPMGF